jgi:hypothetical protein
MPQKLGELLISEGKITRGQLDEALKCHVIYGIKLGSSLVELGYIQEDVLIDLLSRKLGVPPVGHAELDVVPPEAVARFTPAVAEKYRVMPIRLENKRLHVAMADPTDFKTREELSFITGNIIIPNIAPDIQILKAIEKYYNVRLDHRLVTARRELQKIRIKNTIHTTDGFVTDDSQYTLSSGHETGTEPSELVQATFPLEPDFTVPFQGFDSQEWTDSQAVELYTIDKLSLDFSKATDRDDVADIFIKYLGQKFDTCALLTIRGNSAVGWRAVVKGKQIQGFEQTTLELSKSQEFGELFVGKHYFFGTVAESEPNLPLTKALNLTSFNTILSLPVVMNDRFVAMIVVSSNAMSLQHRLEELQKLVYKASLIFQIMVLKNKLLQT